MAEYGGGKSNWVKLALIYLVIGGIVYAVVWYFFLGGNSGGGYTTPGTQTAPNYYK